MRKSISAILILLLLFTLTACGSSKYPINGKKPSSTEERIKKFAEEYPVPTIPGTASVVLDLITTLGPRSDVESYKHEGEDGTFQVVFTQKDAKGNEIIKFTIEYIPNTEDSLTWYQFSIPNYTEEDIGLVEDLTIIPASVIFKDNAVAQYSFCQWFMSYGGKNKVEQFEDLTCETSYNKTNGYATFSFRNKEYDEWASAYNDYVYGS